MAAVMDARVLQRLVDGEVGVVQLHVLADEGDLDGHIALADAGGQRLPFAEADRPGAEAQLLADERVETLLAQRLGHEVDVRHILVGDDRLRLDVGEERDLVADVCRQRVARAADDDVRVDTDTAQLVDRVLRRLRLQLTCRVDEGHERDVEVEDVLGPRLPTELANRLEERQ